MRPQEEALTAQSNSLARQKTWLFLGLCILLTVPYFAIERHLLFPATLLSPTAFDGMIPFSPWAVWLYLSLYPQIALPLLLGRERGELRQMAFGFGWIVVLSHFFFLF